MSTPKRPPQEPSPSPSSPQGRSSSGPSLLRVLTHTQNASAAVFGTFLTLHLAAPVAAAFGGLEAADGIMVLGREVYLPLEPILVYAPLALHLLSSVARRALLASHGVRRLSTHAVAGYALLSLVIPHIMLHRLIPSDPSPPIAALSPSEFGFEFVAHALVTRPWTTAGYLALTGVGVYHAFVGGQKVMRWARALVGSAKQSSPAAASTTSWGGVRAAIGAVLAAVGLGLYRLAQDGDAISTVVVRRFDAVFAAAPWTAIGLE